MSKRTTTSRSLHTPSLRREILGVLSAASAIALVFSFLGFAGAVGSSTAAALFSSLGWLRWVLPVALLWIALRAWMPWLPSPKIFQFFGATIFFVGLWLGSAVVFPAGTGSIAEVLERGLSSALGRAGLWVLVIVLVISGVSIALSFPVFSFCLKSLFVAGRLIVRMGSRVLQWLRSRRSIEGRMATEQEDGTSPEEESFDADPASLFEQRELSVDGAPRPVARAIVKRTRQRRGIFHPTFPIALLDSGDSQPQAGDITGTQSTIRETFENFGIGVEMGEVSVGPTVTQYTLKPATGVKVSQIMGLSNDLALSLAAHPIRIEAPIPGRSLVGIEVPNRRVALVGLRDLLASEAFLSTVKSNPDSLVCTLGKDVAGSAYISRLDRMPHLLIAGATGSGKTVAINILLTSLLYSKGPDELKLLLIDPKRVELPSYNGIPHLLTPVITDLKKTITALKWVLREMDRRFTLLAHAGRRDINSYNSSSEESLPYLVVVIDELADLMVAAASEVEASIIRIAQMARAVGIHLVVATQRPSVDVLTGLIKANMTTRLAFAVASGVDSRTILDTTGAEKLLGRGDCLFVSAELSKPKRLQGAFVSEGEVSRIVAALRALGSPDYVEVTAPLLREADEGESSLGSGEDGDPLLQEAIGVIQQAGRASASLLQRRLKIGYARAARILDLLEARGIIGPGEGAKPREVLIRADVHDRVEGSDSEEDTETLEDPLPQATEEASEQEEQS